MKFNGVMLGTKDSKKLADFYTKILGEPVWRMDDWYGFGEKDCYITIGPHSEVGESNVEPARMIITLVDEDVKAEFDRLKSLGAKVVAEPYQPSMAGEEKVAEDAKSEGPTPWIATVADPDGNYLQIMSPWEE